MLKKLFCNKTLFILKGKKLNSIDIIAFTQVINNIVSVLMGTGNKVYLNYGVAEGRNLKLIRMAFMKNREVSNLYWEI